MKEKLNTKQGISLIVLVITIIVIIILAVAVILTLANNNPIENAKQAVKDNDEATLKEEATLLYADWYLKENSPSGEGSSGYPNDAQGYVMKNLSDGYTEELLDKLQVSNDGKITIGGESASAKKWTWTDSDGDEEKSAGDLITSTIEGLEDEKFYVIKVDGDNVAMLAAKNITEGTLMQSDEEPSIVAFSKTNYWSSYAGTYPLDLNEYTDKSDAEKTSMGVNSGDAIELARAYGDRFKVKGRLMTVEEVEDLGGSRSDVSVSECPNFITGANFWLGSAAGNDGSVWMVIGPSDLFSVTEYNTVDAIGVRPVLEISKNSIEQ